MVLVNGAEGIGTGWSTSIPNYNPLDIVSNIRKLLDEQDPEEMNPWYRFYEGEIYEVPASRNMTSKCFQVSGIIDQVRESYATQAILSFSAPRYAFCCSNPPRSFLHPSGDVLHLLQDRSNHHNITLHC